MNAIKDIFGQLVRRRLWPLAVLLLGALAAVPIVLASEPVTAPPARAPQAKADDPLTTYVTLATPGERAEPRRRVLGASKDPFEPRPLPKPKRRKAIAAQPRDRAPAARKEPVSEPPAGGAPSTSAPPPAAPAPTATPKPDHPAGSVKVRFGAVSEDGELEGKLVERLSVLPDEDNPLIVYRGLAEHGKAALFELTGDVAVEGDGACEPSPENCLTLELRAGETEFVTVTTAGENGTAVTTQYQLDVVKIHR